MGLLHGARWDATRRGYVLDVSSADGSRRVRVSRGRSAFQADAQVDGWSPQLLKWLPLVHRPALHPSVRSLPQPHALEQECLDAALALAEAMLAEARDTVPL